MITIQTPTPTQWDAYVKKHPRAHALQLSAFGALKRAFGWQDETVALVRDSQLIGGAQLLFHALPMKLGTLAYLPMGPYLSDDSAQQDLWNAIHQTAKKHQARFLKWEAGIFLDESPPAFESLNFKPSPQTIQPPNTVLIDLSADEDTILARMNQGTRRKIRQSLKNDIHYYEATQADVSKFTSMMTTTGERNAFGVHDPAYYELAYSLSVPNGDAALFLADHEGDCLAGVFAYKAGDTAWYMYGASANSKRNLMAAYGVQWKAMQWAKSHGCIWYDMWGIPDEPEATLEAEFQTREDGLWGVYGFKRGWGGKIVRAVGAWDVVYNPLIYNAYKAYLKIRA
ncbi:MAG: peptidoglycan bridge formation glycyltransferase FemA/FemB family protein [bacterium]|nr:peptidoglycan bridge formation glycyltransferase FemA/FemB family protein [bacterium]